MATKFGTSGNDWLNDLDYSTGVPIDLGTNDTVFGLEGSDIITLYNGNDTAHGGDGNDGFYDFGNGNDRMYGDAGNDSFFLGLGNDYANGGDGNDWVSYLYSDQAAYVDLLNGFALSQGVDTLVSIENASGTDWNDTLLGNSANNVLNGGNGEDWLDGRSGDDELRAGTGNDTLIGGSGRDTLFGEMGDDVLDGGADNDVIVGGFGNDTMTGGSGGDMFFYSSKSDIFAFDIITDFQQGQDKIDLSALDARPDVGGNQAFTFDSSPDSGTEDFFDGLGGDDWSGLISNEPGPWINGDRGEIEYRHEGGFTYIYLGFGDGMIDASIRLNGTVTLTANDFIL